MNRPDDIPEDVSATARTSASTCRSAIFHLTEKSAGVWAQDGVIEAMNEAFARVILAERERGAKAIGGLERRLHLLAVVADEAITLIENAINDDGSMTEAIALLRASMAQIYPEGSS